MKIGDRVRVGAYTNGLEGVVEEYEQVSTELARVKVRFKSPQHEFVELYWTSDLELVENG